MSGADYYPAGAYNDPYLNDDDVTEEERQEAEDAYWDKKIDDWIDEQEERYGRRY